MGPKKSKKSKKNKKKGFGSLFFWFSFFAVKFFSYFCPQHSANLSECLYSMAKIRVMSNQRRVGRVGDTTYYVRDGEQIARQSRNNSNYGESASRSEAQQLRRVKWANLVNFYRACQFWMPKAFESVKPGQTMYNKFMQLNINESRVALTKDMAQSGCCCPELYQVAKGSFPQIQLSTGDSSFDYKASIVVTQALTGASTVGDLAADIITNNEEILAGDNLAFIFFYPSKDAQDYPYLRSVYKEITLNTSSTVLVSSILPITVIGKTSDNFLGITPQTGQWDFSQFTVIRTRKENGKLRVSSAFVGVEDVSYIGDFITSDWYDECVASYGVDSEVPLDPNFKYGTIQQVTANGVVVRNNDSLTGSQELRIYGRGLNSSNLQLTFNDLQYTPLFTGEDYLGYIIGDNGTVRITLNDSLYMTFTVEDIVIPDDLPYRLVLSQRDGAGSSAEKINQQIYNDKNCANYPYIKNENYPYFGFQIGNNTKPFQDYEDLEGHNCSLYRSGSSESYVYVSCNVVDANAAAYITYKGFIVAVFNYTT